MKTKLNIERLAESAGATLEEDVGHRDMRVFQVVAPKGKRWHDGGVVCLRLYWARGFTPSAVKYNDGAYRDVASRIARGLENIPAEEAELYAVD